MSGDGTFSADPSIEVVEEKLDGVVGNKQTYCSDRWYSRHESEENDEEDLEEKQEKRRILLSLPPRAESRYSGATDGDISAIEENEDRCDTSNVTEQWQDRMLNAESDHDDGVPKGEVEVADEMAERVLTTLQRKDRLLEKQAYTLKVRETELENLRLELSVLHKEKEFLLRQLQGCVSCTAPAPTLELEVNGEKRPADSSFLLRRVDMQLQDERAERQQDAAYFKAHIDQLTEQLAQAQRDAAARETRHAQDLDVIQREMNELSVLVDDVYQTKENMRRIQEQLAKATEEKLQCQLERDCAVRALQDELRREKLEGRHQLDSAQAEVRRWEAVAAAAEKKYRETEDRKAQTEEEARALRLKVKQMDAEHAALRLEAVGELERLRHLQEQRFMERTAAAEEKRQQLEAQLKTALCDAEQLHSMREVQSNLLAEDNTRREEFQEEVAMCVRGTQQLEEALMRCEQRRHDAEERERLTLDERDSLRTQLQQLSMASRQELLEQQQLAEEMREFHQAKLQQLQQVVEHQRQYAGRLEKSNSVTHAECAVLRTSLKDTRRQFDGAVAELQQLRQQCATLETRLAEAQQACDECGAREQQNAEQLETMRKRLQVCERSRRALKAQVQRLEEHRQLLKLADATNLLSCITEKKREQRQNSGKKDRRENGEKTGVGEAQLTAAGGDENGPRVLVPSQSRGSLVEMWQAKLRALESRNASLQQQLGAKLNGHRALVEDRKALQRQLNKLHETAQREISALERQHRDAIKHLEDMHRRRLSAACLNMADATRCQELCIRRGIAFVVSELMSFFRALDAHAALIRSRAKSNNSASVCCICCHDEKEDMLRDACDDIARNLLGLEGGWEALLHCSSSGETASRDRNNQKNNGMIPDNVLRHVQSFLVEHFEEYLLKKSVTAAAGYTVRHYGACNKKSKDVSFATTNDGDIKIKKDRNYLGDGDCDTVDYSSGDQPLVKVFMECVKHAFP